MHPNSVSNMLAQHGNRLESADERVQRVDPCLWLRSRVRSAAERFDLQNCDRQRRHSD
jgi:hypothetical protein